MSRVFKKLFELLKTPLGTIAVAAILAFTPLSFVSFFLVLLVTARFIPFRAGIITCLAFSFCITICVFGCFAALAWATGLALNSTLILFLLLLPLAVIAFINKNKPGTNPGFGTDHDELLAAGLALLTMVFITLPLLQAPSGATLLRVVSAGGDNSSHLTMVKVSDLNHGLAYGLNNRVNPMPGAVSYPHTWHFSVTFFSWLLKSLPFGNSDSPTRTLVIFYGSALFWFGLLVFLITRCALRLSRLIVVKKSSIATTVAVLVCAGITAHWLLQLFTNGFQSQIASLVMIMAEVYLLAEAYNQPANKRYVMLLLAGVLAVGSTFMWVFLMPVALGILGLCVLQTAIVNKKLPLAVTLGFVVIGLFMIFQPLLILLFPVGFEGGESMILQRGFINPTSIEALVVITALSAVASMLHGRNQPQRVLFTGVCVALGFSVALMLYQLYAIGELRYFYFKSTYTAIVLGGALLGATAYYFSYKILGNITKYRSIILTIVLVTGALVVWQIKDPTALKYIDGSLNGMSTQTAHAVLLQTARGPKVSANTTFLGNCNRGDDIRASLFTAALTKTMVYQNLPFDQSKHDQNLAFQTAANSLKTSQTPITIVSNDQQITAALKAYLGAEAQNPKLEIIELDQTPETEPISQCPDRIRDIQKFPVQ